MIVFCPLPQFLTIDMLSLSDCVKFTIPYQFRAVETIGFSIAMITCCPTTGHTHVLRSFPLLTVFFPISVVEFGGLLSYLTIGTTLPPTLRALLVFLFNFCFTIAGVNLCDSICLTLLRKYFLSKDGTILMVLHRYTIALTFNVCAQFARRPVAVTTVVAICRTVKGFGALLIGSSCGTVFSPWQLFSTFFVVSHTP